MKHNEKEVSLSHYIKTAGQKVQSWPQWQQKVVERRVLANNIPNELKK